MTFEQFKSAKLKLDAAVSKASDELKSFCGNTSGAPLSDEIKNSSEYKILKFAFYSAFGDLQKFNSLYAKKYSRMALLERRLKT